MDRRPRILCSSTRVLACSCALGLVGCADGAGTVRTYYIAAEVVDWDYLPSGADEILGHPRTDSAYFVNSGARSVSSIYKKVLYREYADHTFTALKPRPPEWEHLGFLGPVIRGVVGDTIKVVFRNNGERPYAVHPHGVFYLKDSEGAPYNDETSDADKADDGVPPGGTHVYVWPVPERAGPAPHDPSSVFWMYHSHADEVKDANVGLVGPMIITARGRARPDGSPKNVDRELVTAFSQIHEEDSWHARANLAWMPKDDRPRSNPGIAQGFYPFFVKFTVNGFTHGSLPLDALTVRKGERVRWYVFSTTNDFDFHTPHWHGNTVTIGGMRTDVASIIPMEMIIADMVPDNVGVWLYHCHVSFHLQEGMQVRYAVVD